MAYPEGVVDLTGDNAMPAMWDQPVVPSPVVQEPTVDSYESSFETSSAVIIDEEEERRRSRARALGEVDRGADVVIAPVAYEPPTMYQPWPSFVLILLRFLVAAILAIHATQQVLNLAGTTALWENSLLPGGEVWTITMIIVQYLTAVLLVLGLGVRGVGIGIMVAFIIVLCFLQWGAEPFFVDKVSGFRGEVEVFLVMAGLMFVGLGGGSIGVDGAIHRARLERKNTTISQEV
jgi:putative oxidoreductase